MRTAALEFSRRKSDGLDVMPRVRWSQPHALGTGLVQCITDYIAEVADRHWMTTLHFWRGAIQRDVLSRKQTGASSRFEFCSANGHGPRALRVVSALREAGLPSEYHYLSYIPLGNVLDCRSHGLLSDELKWCVECWRDDYCSIGRPYVRLLWISMPINVCTIHRTILENRCNACGAKQFVVSLIPRPWICGSCGNELFHKVTTAGQRKSRAADLWKAMACERLIDRICSADEIICENAIRLGLSRLVELHASGSVYKFAHRINFEHMLVHTWKKGRSNPTLPSLLEFCYRTNTLPDELLSAQNAIAEPLADCQEEKPRFTNRRLIDKSALNRARDSLNKLIARNPRHAPSTKEIARELHLTYANLQYHFPRHYRILRKRYLKWIAQLAIRDARLREKRLIDGVAWLRRRNVFPSERHLKALTGVLPSDLRRSEIAALLRKLQRSAPTATNKSRNQSKRYQSGSARSVKG